jgi:PIN domain nuclease of toxin-antitoxin system
VVLSDDPKLSSAARGLIGNPDVEVFVSAATIWEIAIKVKLGKLEFDGDPLAEIAANGMRELVMTGRHALAAGCLPRHHDDPFDRMPNDVCFEITPSEPTHLRVLVDPEGRLGLRVDHARPNAEPGLPLAGPD